MQVLEIQDIDDSNYQRTWIMCPAGTQQILNIRLSVLVIILKNLEKHVHFQLQFVDKNNVRQLVNFSTAEIKKANALVKSMPPRVHLYLEPRWNKLEIDLNQLAHSLRLEYKALCRLKIYSNCRIRKIYMVDKHYEDDELPLSLYQGFLDNYMEKWGIREVERATQTKKTFRNAAAKDANARMAHGFNKLFMKNLQSKSDRVIEDFFSKLAVKSVKDYLEFKQKAKIKPYYIPEIIKNGKSPKNSNSSLTDINDIKKSILHDNYVYGKLSLEKKKDEKPKASDSKEDKEKARYSVYRIQQYRYPALKINTVKFNEKSSRHPFLNKISK